MNAHCSLSLTAMLKKGDKEGAINYYNTILDKLADADNRSLAELKLADLLRAEEQFEEAAVQYQAVGEGNPAGEYADDALYLVGLCYYQVASEKPELLASSETAFKRVITDLSG